MPQLPPWSPGGWAPGDWQPNYEQPPNEGGGNLPPVEWSPPEWQNPFNTTNPGDNTPLSSSAGTVADYPGRRSAPPGSVGNGLPSLGQITDFLTSQSTLATGAGLLGRMYGGSLGGMLGRGLVNRYFDSQPEWWQADDGGLQHIIDSSRNPELGQATPLQWGTPQGEGGRFIRYDDGTVTDTLTGYTYTQPGGEGAMPRRVSSMGTYRGSGGHATAVSPEEGARMFGNPFYQPGEMIDNRPQGERRE